MRPESAFAASLCVSYLLSFHIYPFAAFYNDWIVIFGVAITVILLARNRRTVVRIPWIAILPLCVAALIALQAILGMLAVSWDAVFPIAYCLLAAFCIVLGATLGTRQSHASPLFQVLSQAYLFAGLLSVGIAIVQYLGLAPRFSPLILTSGSAENASVRPFANVGQPNELALLLCFSIACCWYIYQVNRLKTAMLLVFCLLLLVGLVLTQSRIGWIIIPTYALLLLFLRQKSDVHPISCYLTLGFVVLYALLVIFLPDITHSLLDVEIASPMQHIGIGNASERVGLAYQALYMSLTHPWFGVGWYQFGPQQIEIAYKFPPSTYSQHSHNIMLNFAAELGWPFTVMFFGIIIYWIFKCYFGKSTTKEGILILLVFIAVSVHSLVEFPLWYAYVLLPVSFFIGLIHQERIGAKGVILSRWPFLAAALLLIFGLLFVARDYRRLTLGFTALEFELKGYRISEINSDLPKFTLFPHFYQYFQFLKLVPRSGMTAKEIDSSAHVVSRFGNASVLLELAQIYSLNGKPIDAANVMLTIEKLHHCIYPKYYKIWDGMVAKNPGGYAKTFVELPKPNFSECGSALPLK